MKWALVTSFAVHVVVVALLTFHMPEKLTQPSVNVVEISLIAPAKKQVSQPAKPVRTQASAAPKTPPKPKVKKVPVVKKKAVRKVKKRVKKETKEVKKEKESPPRPPKLDKTPDKKILKNDDPNAKVVSDPDDFLKTLDFIDDLASQKKDEPKPEETLEEKKVRLDFSDQAEVGRLRNHIEQNWVRPAGLKAEKLEAVVALEVNPDGTIRSLTMVQSSGKAAYDNSLLRAVRKAEPLPIPVKRYEKFKQLDLYFKG